MKSFKEFLTEDVMPFDIETVGENDRRVARKFEEDISKDTLGLQYLKNIAGIDLRCPPRVEGGIIRYPLPYALAKDLPESYDGILLDPERFVLYLPERDIFGDHANINYFLRFTGGKFPTIDLRGEGVDKLQIELNISESYKEKTLDLKGMAAPILSDRQLISHYDIFLNPRSLALERIILAQGNIYNNIRRVPATYTAKQSILPLAIVSEHEHKLERVEITLYGNENELFNPVTFDGMQIKVIIIDFYGDDKLNTKNLWNRIGTYFRGSGITRGNLLLRFNGRYIDEQSENGFIEGSIETIARKAFGTEEKGDLDGFF